MSKSKEQELFEAYFDQAFKKGYADHVASNSGKSKSMSDVRVLVDQAASALREDFGPEDYDDLLRYAAFVEVFKRESEDNLRELTETLIQHKRLLELLESDEANGALKDKIVALLKDSPIIGRTIDAGKRHGERLRSKAGAIAKLNKHAETKTSIKEAYLAFLAGGGKDKKRFVSKQAELHGKGESAIRSYITEWNKEIKNQPA